MTCLLILFLDADNVQRILGKLPRFQMLKRTPAGDPAARAIERISKTYELE